MEYISVLLVSLTVVLLILIARKAQGGVSFLLYVLSFYWTASYVLRPLLFLYARDNDIDNKIYDTRIGKSAEDFISILQNVVIGNVVFCITTYLLLQRKKLQKPGRETPEELLTNTRLLKIALVAGILSSFIERTDLRNPFSKSLVSIVAFSLCAYLWNRNKYKLARMNEMILLSSGIATVLFVAPTSGHFKGLVLTPILVFLYKWQFLHNQKSLLVKFVSLVLIALMFIPFFSFLQKQRLGTTYVNLLLKNSNEFPWFISPFLNLAIRFDQFARISDVHFAGTGILGGWDAWTNLLLRNLQWNPTSGREIGSFGTLWNQVVTNATVPGARYSPVSFAQGMIAEGLIWKNLSSLLVVCVAMALVFHLAGKLLDGGFISAVTAFALIGNGTMFESGLVQEFASISAALKNLLFLISVAIILKIPKSQRINKRR